METIEDLQKEYNLPQEYVNIINKLGTDWSDIEYTVCEKDDYTYDGSLNNLEQLLKDVDSKCKSYNIFEEAASWLRDLITESSTWIEQELSKAFCMGSLNEGRLVFHPADQSVWLIYFDGYTKKLDDSFAAFMKKVKLDEITPIRSFNYKVVLVSADNKIETIKLLKTYIPSITSIECKQMIDKLPCTIMENVQRGINDNMSCLVIDDVYYKPDEFAKSFSDIGAVVEIEEFYD